MKNDYKRDSFWSCKNEENGEVKFFIKINNQMVEVSREVYNVCFNSYAKCLRDNRKETGKTLSFDATNGDSTFADIVASNVNVESDVLDSIEIQRLYHEISLLSEQEKYIIASILIDGKSMRKIAKEMGMPVMSLQDKKVRILSYLKEKLKK